MTQHFTPLDPVPWLQLLEGRFGIPAAVFADFVLFRQNAKYIALVARDHLPPAEPSPTSTGLPFMRTALRYPKLTTAAAMLFGHHATHNYVDLDRAQAEAYMSRETLRLDAAQTQACTDTGYVLARHEAVTLGLAFFRLEENQGGPLESLYPKVWAGQRMK